MKKRLTLVISALLLSAFALSACSSGGGGEATTAGSEGGSSAAQKEAEAGDAGELKEIHVQVGPSPETIDPALNTTVDGGNMIIHAFEGLLKFDQNNNVVAGLAESHEVSEDGLTWTFHLREGLKWSDGSDLTAKDFEYSWKRMADPLTAAPYGYDLLNMIEGYDQAMEGNVEALKAEAVDDKTFVVTLKNPCTYFDKIAAFASLVPVQQATIEANGDGWTIDPATYVTSGPYYMTEFTDGAQIVFEKNPNYHDVTNITFDKIVWHLIEDANTAYTAYTQGDLSMIKTLPTEEIPSLRGSDEFHVDPNMGTYYVSFNTTKAPFDNAKVREALSLVIDRDYVANTIMQGTYLPAKNFVGPGVSDAEPGKEFQAVTEEKYGVRFDPAKHQEDVEKAKKLLEEAGYPGGEGFPTIEYSTNDQLYHKPVAEYLQSVRKEELGITVNINIEEWKTFSANRRAGNFEVARNGWIYDWDDPSNMINLLETNNGNNDGKFSNAEFDKLVEAARTTKDVKEHYDLLHQAEQVLLNEAAMAPIAYYTDPYLLKSNVKGTWHSPYGYWYFMYGIIE
ncbi:MAG: peptide ABC transporter substrate-binding protein [Johnsonella sp.]|nr:peptide ABC transporter substrate-binding protein [Johnsonella sp.]